MMVGDPQIVVAITGASGAAYAKRLVEQLIVSDCHVHLIVSPHGRQLLTDELGTRSVTHETFAGATEENLTLYSFHDVGCRLASGSFLTHGMVICPCSSNTLASVAAGMGDNLIARAAHVALKESRRLILVHREMPISGVDIENYGRLNRAGAIICPAAPGFYLLPESVQDLVDFVVAKVLDLLGVEHDLIPRWTGTPPKHETRDVER
jgi:4-hydroxy-3-polyprenylbenzoate decarboxylase